jgi:predicted solute-binding protein
MRAGDLDVALLPVVELARMPDLEVAPGLGIVCDGATRSVLLVSSRPVDEVRSVALDPESRTSNALVRVLFDRVWRSGPEYAVGPTDLDEALRGADAAVRIGDKALFEHVPTGCRAIDLGTVWHDRTGLPFVFAVWAGRPGTLDRDLYRALHASRREGSRHLDAIADDYALAGGHRPEVARAYLRENIRFRLGSGELRALETFLGAAAALGLVERAPEVRLALGRRSACHERVEAMHLEEER